MTTTPEQRVEDAARAMEAQMEDEAVQTLPSSMCRERGLLWLEGWFDLAAALAPLEAENARLREATTQAVAMFRFYAANHRAKGTAEGDLKAQTNDKCADDLEAALQDKPA
jgi:hypothetical protein